MSQFLQEKLEKDAKKNWDLFYRRNGDRFFKDRHWTLREFQELESCDKSLTILEVGCGAGNFVFPLLQDDSFNHFIYACDFSDEAIKLVHQHPQYCKAKCKAFVADLTSNIVDKFREAAILSHPSVDAISLIFVLSAIHPDKMLSCVKNLFEVSSISSELMTLTVFVEITAAGSRRNNFIPRLCGK